jgi:acyl carrier protein
LQSIKDEIHEYLVTELATERESFRPDENLLEQGVIDSLAIVKLVGFLEERFEIEVDDEERIPENFESIDALSAFVQKKRNA